MFLSFDEGAKEIEEEPTTEVKIEKKPVNAKEVKDSADVVFKTHAT